jgi:hypothetical protein
LTINISAWYLKLRFAGTGANTSQFNQISLVVSKFYIYQVSRSLISSALSETWRCRLCDRSKRFNNGGFASVVGTHNNRESASFRTCRAGKIERVLGGKATKP